tara:strand:+ start:560 stop:1828 length:1269 start_codon:yes stop_codon:yes gene_type:complete
MAATSTQDMVRPGECLDLFYYDGETSKKQCFPTTQNTKYVQQFANLTGGSSVFTIPPNSGIQDVVCEFTFAGIATPTGLGLPRGWGYALIKQVSFRYGGSSQFFLTGDQILQNALRSQTSRTSADDLLTLGGNFASSTSTPALTAAQYAAVVLRLPHSIPSGVGKAHPFPTDLLTQQVQITVELYPVNQIWSTNTGGVAPPTSLANAQFQVQQCVLNNAGDALARRVDMAVNAYAFPCEFVQQVQRIALANTASSQSVVLTGFRSGEVKAIHCWLTRTSDTDLNTTAASVPTDVVNPFNWQLPLSIQMTYAGDIYARYEFASSPLWNLINGNKAPAVDTVILSAGAPPTAAASLSQWVELPFAQTMLDEDAHYVLTHGKPITNGIVNLDLTTPSAQGDWVLNVSYIYNATLLMSQGTADYVF